MAIRYHVGMKQVFRQPASVALFLKLSPPSGPRGSFVASFWSLLRSVGTWMQVMNGTETPEKKSWRNYCHLLVEGGTRLWWINFFFEHKFSFLSFSVLKLKAKPSSFTQVDRWRGAKRCNSSSVSLHFWVRITQVGHGTTKFPFGLSGST